jgi:hypothetical protein
MMMSRKTWRSVCGAASAAMLLLPQTAGAQSGDQFYKGKTINLYIGFGPGGTYDYYGPPGRTLPGPSPPG